MEITGFSIAAVERDTGVSKDALRVWERRYGFPSPARDSNGERVYPIEQVERLRLIKRLIDQGFRPGKLIAAPPEALALLAQQSPVPRPEPLASVDLGQQEALLELIRQHDIDGYLEAMQQQLGRQGLQRFVMDTVAPLTYLVGEAWQQGRIKVFEEHLFTELTRRLLRSAIAALPVSRKPPRVLLTSVPDEAHLLGLLMVEALLVLEGATCIPLGPEMPLTEIAGAATAHRADIVALSFSAAFPQRQIGGLLEQLRGLLDADIQLWVGGSGVDRLTEPGRGIRLFSALGSAVDAVAEWRVDQAAGPRLQSLIRR